MDVESYFLRIEEHFGEPAVLEGLLDEAGADADLSQSDREALELRAGQYLADTDVEAEGATDTLLPEDEPPEGMTVEAFEEPAAPGTR